MTRRSVGDPTRTVEMRWRLVRRGLLLYAGGLLFDFVWPGTILPYYGAMFVLAALLFTLRIRWILLAGAVATVAGALVSWWIFERRLDDEPVDWLTAPTSRSPRGLVFDVAVNGTHPILPWMAFFCAGIVVGRLLPHAWWRPAVIGAGFALYSSATVLTLAGSSPTSRHLLSDDPFDRGLVYVASALGTALIAFGAISWLADQYEHTVFVDWLRRAGQLSLTVYLAHALLFNFLVGWLGPWAVERTDSFIVERLTLQGSNGIGTALTFAAIFWITAIFLAVAYQRRYGRGPTERLYRLLTA